MDKIGKMSKKSSLKNNFFFNFISQILTLLIPLITTPYLARIFHESGNGQVAFANNILTYFTMIANFGFAIYGQREIAKYQDNKYMRSKTFWEIILIRLFLVLFSISILFATLSVNLYGESYTLLILIGSIQVFGIIFDVNFYYQGQEDFKSIAIRTLVLRLICLIFIFIFVKKETDMWIYILIFSLSVVLSNLVMRPKLRKSITKISFKELEYKKHAFPSFIIFLSIMAATVFGTLNNLMIGYLCPNPDYENGNYFQGMKLNQTILMLVIVIDSIMVARNSYDHANGDDEKVKEHINFACDYVWHIGIPLLIGMCVLSNSISSWFLGEGYDEVPMILNILSVRFITSALGCVFGNQLFIAIGKEKYNIIAHIITTITILILNFIFIPLYGAIGAAITCAIAESVDCLVLLIIAIRTKKVSLKKILPMTIKPLLASSLMFVVIFFMNKYITYSVWSFLLIALVGLVIYIGACFIIKDSFFINLYNRYVKTFFKRNKQ
ncbi:MAG: flippase [Bacilli bacterium]